MKSPGITAVLPMAGVVLLGLLPLARAELLAGWETTGQTLWGTQELASTAHHPSLTIGGLTRGPGVVSTNGFPSANGWGGRGWNAESYEDGVSAGRYFTFTVTPAEGSEVSVETFTLHYRRSSEGPIVAALQFQIGSGGFVDVEELELSAAADTGATANNIDLMSIPGLQNHSGTPITFRLIPYLAADEDGEFYVWGEVAGLDLTLQGEVTGSGAGDTSPPLINGLTPSDNAIAVTATEAQTLTVVFNEPVARGTGAIVVKDILTGTAVNTLNVTNPAQVVVSGNQIELVMATALTAGLGYYVEIPAGAIVDASPAANPFAGISGTAAWNFTLVEVAVPPTVVVNKLFNGTPDRVELLVVGNGSAGSTVNLQGMILKDFSSDMTSDGGGKILFANHPLWAAVPAGTLITLSTVANSPDIAGGDFKLAVGLYDSTYFSPVPGSPEFDITPTDMVMLKHAGSDPAGTTGGIHTLGSGPAAALSYFTLFTGAKVRAATTGGANLGTKVTNTTGALADYVSGTDASSGIALSLADFGVPNSGTNAAYLAALRGRAAGSGDGTATVVNATLASPFLSTPIFASSQSAQSAKVTLNAQISGVILTHATVTVPASLGTPSAAILSGPGSSGASVSLNGQTVTISSASATVANALELTISGLSTPVPILASDSGNYPLTITTSAAGGVLTPLAHSPAVRVIVPITALRDVDGTGISFDSGIQVAVEGVATEADFGGGAANFSGFIQDANAGINLFSPSLNLGLVRGNRYVVTGTVAQVNGQTAIIPASAAQIIDRGAVTETKPQIVSLATLFANPEAFEGKLITLKNLSLFSGSWAPGVTVSLRDGTLASIDVRIQSGSTATAPPFFPANVTGVFGQSDGSSPFTSSYLLMPRDPNDLATTTDFDLWTIALGITTGPGDDPDIDGRNNAYEYTFGLNPASADSKDPIVSILDPVTGKLIFTRRIPALSGMTSKVFTSTTLAGWTRDMEASLNVINTAAGVETVEVTLSAPAPLAAPKLFIRIAVE